LINIGPKADAQPEESFKFSAPSAAGWKERAVALRRRCLSAAPVANGSSRRGNTLYFHVHFWPGGDGLAFAGLQTKVKSVSLLASGQRVEFEQILIAYASKACRKRHQTIPLRWLLNASQNQTDELRSPERARAGEAICMKLFLLLLFSASVAALF
jgi:hypothetical protein